MKSMINFREMQKAFKVEYFNVKIKQIDENGEKVETKVRVFIRIDRGGRIIDCTRVGMLFSRLYGRQLLSVHNGVNPLIAEIVYDEIDRINNF